MTLSADVVIIGAGIVGASVAYHLARRGLTNVIVVEKEPVEVTGSTARSAAGVRRRRPVRCVRGRRGPPT